MAFEATRLFLYRVLPWHPVGRADAFVNVHWTFQGAGYNKPAWSGRACISIDECINSIQWAQRNADTRDFYVCTSTQRECEERQTRNNRTMRIAKRGQDNAVQMRALYLDVDVKDGTHHADGYDDLAQAAAASLKFCADAGLPRPTLYVKTGSGGLHFYWCLDQALDVATWQPLANALAEATRRFGLRADTAVTVDSARVMRIPGTKHSRTGNLAEMNIEHVLAHDYTLDQMRHALAPYMGAQVIPLTPRGKLAGPNAELAGGIETPKALPINIDTVAQAGCGFIAEALRTGGQDYANPLWNLTTLVSVFTEGGHVDAHRMASGWPNYDPAETEELFQRKQREQAEKNLGWPSCQSVENAGCASCKTCPLKGPGTRPLQFGRPTQVPVQAPVPIAPDLPHGYSRNADGYIFRTLVAPDGTSRQERVVNKPIFKGWMQNDPWGIHFDVELTPGDVKQIACLISQANTVEGFAKHMGDCGIPLNDNERKLFREFVVAWQTKLQQIKDAVVTSHPYGWSEPNGKTNGFAYGGRVWQKGTDKPAANADPRLARFYTPRGELKPWIDAAKMVTDLRTPERDVFIAAGFAAPLVKPANVKGLFLSAYSDDSGRFKSTAMAVALGVWSNPKMSKVELNDTQNSVFNKIGAVRHLPIFWDEIQTDEQAQNIANLVFRMTGGRERSRMNADSSIRAQGEWETLLMSASNNSLIDPIVRANKTTTAGLYRLFEFEVGPVDSPVSAATADAMVAALDNNYGHAGLLYAKFLGSEYERVKQEVRDCRERIETALKLDKPERLWGGIVSVLYMGAVYANELQLTNIDLKALMGFLVKTLQKMRAEIKAKPVSMADEAALSNVFQQYLSEMQGRHMLVTDRMHLNRGKPAMNSVKVHCDVTRLDGIRVHLARESHILRLATTPFREWCHAKSYPAHTIINAFKEKWRARETQARLGGGTPFVSMIEYIIELDTTQPELAKLIEY
jgi:hypothetical protein